MTLNTNDKLLAEIVGESQNIQLTDFLSGNYYVSGISTKRQALKFRPQKLNFDGWNLLRQPNPYICNARFNLMSKVEQWQRFYSMSDRRVSCYSYYALICSLEAVAKELYFCPGIIDYCISKTRSISSYGLEKNDLKQFWEEELERQRKSVALEIENLARTNYDLAELSEATYNPDYHLRALLCALKFGMTKEAWDVFYQGARAKGLNGFWTRITISPSRAVSTTIPAEAFWLKILGWLRKFDDETLSKSQTVTVLPYRNSKPYDFSKEADNEY